MSSFIEKCLKGRALLEEVDEYVENWHEDDQGEALHSFLGMTRGEYGLWLADPDVLPFIVDAHRRNISVSESIEEFQRLPLAARSDSPTKATQLLAWLKTQGLWHE